MSSFTSDFYDKRQEASGELRPRTKKLVAACGLTVSVSGDKHAISAVRIALEPETATKKRSTLSVRVSRDQKSLLLEFSSKDLSSLRAALNTNLRLASAALKTIYATRTEKISEAKHRKTE